MPQRRILYLDNSRLTAYKAGGGTVTLEATFQFDEAGTTAFGDFLKSHRRSIFMLLVDVAEEGFQLEAIPHSSGRDRVAIVTRKLGQYFYGTPFALATSQGRLKTGRRDENLLMMALTRPQSIEPWLHLLREHKVALSGIYSLPQLMLQLVPKDAPPQLLLLARTHGGLRQTFFADRQLRFSRLTPLATGTEDEYAIAAALEAGKMLQYLSSQRLVERGKPLTTHVLAHPTQIEAIRGRCHESRELHFEFADLLNEAKRTGLRSRPDSSQAEILFCHLLGRHTPTEQFAPATERQYFRLWQSRAALTGASAVIFASGLLFAIKQGTDLLRMQEATSQVELQIRSDQQRYDAVLQALPKIPISTENMVALVSRYEQLDKRAQGPAPLLAQLSQSLDVFPAVTVEKLDWKLTEQLVSTPPPPLGQPPAASPPPNMASGPYAQLIVTAQLPLALSGNHRGQLTLVADFVKHLAKAPDTLAVIVQPPVDTQSEKTLKSGEEKRVAEAPKFVVRLTRKL